MDNVINFIIIFLKLVDKIFFSFKIMFLRFLERFRIDIIEEWGNIIVDCKVC